MAGFAPVSTSMNLDLNQLLPSETDVNSTGTSSSKQNQTTSLVFDPATKAFLDNILGSKTYSKEAAITDSQDAAKWAINQTLQAGAPGISSAAKVAGGYNNTTAELLNNDLTAKASAAGQSVLLDTITKYANAQSSQVNSAAGAVNVTTGRKVDATSDTTTTENKVSSSEGQLAGTVNKFVPAIGGKGTVICTQLYLDGHIPVEIYQADRRYVAREFSADTQNGYRFWAVPFVGLMRRNKVAYAIGKYFGVRWSYYCASRIMRGVSPNIVGIFTTATLLPVCWLLGKIVPTVSYTRLWSKEL
jgi:hypothetical protein